MKITRTAVLLLLGILLVSGFACCPPPTGTNVYSKYGFSFEYPAGASILEVGLGSPTADEDSGLVSWEKADEALGLGWLKTLIWDSEVEENVIDAGLERAEANADAFELVGGSVTTQMSGFDVMYQLFEITAEGEERNGMIAVWYCEPGTTAFWVVYFVTDSALTHFEDFLSTFECQ